MTQTARDEHGDVTLLVVDDDAQHAETISESLRRSGYRTLVAGSGKAALEALEGDHVDIVLTDLVMRDVDGMEVLTTARRLHPDIEVVVMTGYASVEGAVEAMKKGASTYLKKPLNIQELRAVVEKVVEKQNLSRSNLYLHQELDRKYGFSGILGNSEPMQKVFTTLQSVAPTSATVLIVGESGTGKELVAKAIHRNSPRRNHHFIPINCTAMPEGLIESELFGHEKGSFTGALGARKGRFEFANHGTLLLDEIGDMPLSTQAKLLRVLEERCVYRVGSNVPIPVDVRLLASTNRHLEELTREGKFREDLYYRLRVVTINLPPLRTRQSDIAILIDHFIREFAQQHGRRIEGITPAARALLLGWRWPGNVRELRNSIEAMVVLARDPILDVKDVPEEIQQRRDGGGAPAGGGVPSMVGMKLEQAEVELIRATLAMVKGNREEAARILGIGERTLYRKLKEYGLGEIGKDGGGAP
ncbi:MAG: sigma-54-dependent Fis family transcriptional regulator [Candidatus Brocadiae bacterium]|nr:sigma-54-dependent Fis family transcriptional regulator [Candidatus Brocadiia bacterium]